MTGADPGVVPLIRAGSSRREYLEASLRLLWPAPSVISFCGRRRVTNAEQYVLLPNGRDPKAMVPRRPLAVSAAAVRNYKTSANPRQRLQHRALSWAARLGGTAVLPDQVCIRSSAAAAGGIDQYLAGALQRRLHVCLYIGAPRANRKPVLQLISDHGGTFAFAKIGTSALTRELVRHEAATLDGLAQSSFEHLIAPRALHYGEWNGHNVLVQAALTGDPADAAEVVTEAMLELARRGETAPQPAAASPYWRRLRDKLTNLPDSPLARALREVMPALQNQATTQQVRLGSWHGDWTPWNMTMWGAKVALWDWERFEPGVPWGFDALHFRLQGSIVRGRADPRRSAAELIEEAPKLLAPFGCDPPAATFTALTYLVEIATRYLADDLAAAGGRLGPLDKWLLPALNDHLGLAEGPGLRP
jgi:hypothetical protein